MTVHTAGRRPAPWLGPHEPRLDQPDHCVQPRHPPGKIHHAVIITARQASGSHDTPQVLLQYYAPEARRAWPGAEGPSRDCQRQHRSCTPGGVVGSKPSRSVLSRGSQSRAAHR
jgi:hypothetical protein